MSSGNRVAVFTVAFAAVYSAVYYFAVDYNWALFSYGPAVGEWALLARSASAGPTMYWYGWIATSAIAGAVAGAIVCALPQNLIRRVWPGFAWLVPMGAIAAIGYLLSGYLTR
jgi:hypothetical protein